MQLFLQIVQGAANEIQEYLEESATQGVWSVYAKNLILTL